MNIFKSLLTVCVGIGAISLIIFGATNLDNITSKTKDTSRAVIANNITDEDIKLADNGDNASQLKVGTAYYFEQSGLKKDVKKGYDYLVKASAQGNADAMNMLGVIYFNGIDVEQNYAKAFDYFTKSAEAGSDDALNSIALMYELGLEVEQNTLKSVEIYEELAKRNYLDAIVTLAIMYETGQYVEQSYTKAIEYYTKSLEHNSDIGQYALGYFYQKGLGVEQNTDNAIKYLTMAAEQGNADAVYSLAIIHFGSDKSSEELAKAFGYAWVAVTLNEENKTYIDAFNTMNSQLSDNIRKDGELFGFNLMKTIKANTPLQ